MEIINYLITNLLAYLSDLHQLCYLFTGIKQSSYAPAVSGLVFSVL